jgi:acyl transferase domain-containing protein
MSPAGDIAIVGMAGLFPRAPDVATFWQNILDKVDAVTERGAEPGHRDRGGFLDGLVRFDPADHGVLPRSIDGGDPEHFVALRLAREALADAGYLDRPFPRKRAAVILGRANYGSRGYGTLFQHAVVVDQVIHLLTALHPEHSAAELASIEQQLRASLPPFDADTAPGLVPNVLCGRIANRLDLMGSAYVVDAACASSLVAIELAMSELLRGKADLALAGGIHVSSTVPITMLFDRLGALSRRGAVRPFSADADGTLLGEGAGIVVLKRRTDAERDGDRIYAVLKSVGVASDGRAVGVLAPRVEGEELAMRRAYDAAGVSPGSVALVEAHGTGTRVGDAVELEALGRVFGPRDHGGPWRALGSVKSMIGHPIPAAGVAGLIKAALALHHKVLPPTLDGGGHAAALDSTPFHLNTETRPWIHVGPQPRRAAVSAFGFGGINAHAVLEEHPGYGPSPNLHRRCDAEVLVLSGRDRADLRQRGTDLRRVLAGRPDIAIVDLAYTLNCAPAGMAAARLAIVATSVADLDGKLALALDRLADPTCWSIEEHSGIYYTEAPLYVPGALAFLFPGQGAQYSNMLADLCVRFPEVRAWFDLMDRPFAEQRRPLPSRLLFPPRGGRKTDEPEALWALDYGLTAVYTANQALSGLLGRLGIRPDAVLGHSSGDFSALWEAGVLPVDDDAELVRQVVVLNEVYEQLRGEGRLPSGTLLAVSAADPEHVRAVVERSDGALTVAIDNCPRQVVLGGCAAAAAAAADELRQAGAVCAPLPLDYLPHTPHFTEFAARLHELHRQREGQLRFHPPRTALYSCVTAGRYPTNPAVVRGLVADQWSHPVRFRETIEKMYADGVRIFVEVGPRGSLASFTADVLRGTPHVAVPADVEARSGVTQLAHLVGLLAAHHVPMTLDHLYAHRSPRRLWTAAGPASVPPPELDRSVRLTVDLPLLTLDRPAPQPTTQQPTMNAREQVMVAYLDTMDKFLDVQRHAARSHLSAPAPPPLPLLGSVVSCTAGQELVSLRRLDPEQDLFLRDHTFGRAVSQVDPSLLGLPVVPFTVSIELLAEAAATLCPGRVVVGARHVRAHQWIALDDGPVTLRVVARRVGSEVAVELYQLSDDGDGSQAGTRMVEGTVVLADCYPPPEAAPALTLRDERTCRQAGPNLYTDRMFHGPRFQGVVSLDRWGEDGISATMTTLPTGDLFAATPEPALLTDPQLLDAAGQVVGFWALEHHDRDSAFFPFGLDELQLFGPPPPAGTPVTGHARISLAGGAQLRSDLDLAGPDGWLLARLTGWANHRLDLPEPLARLGISPRDAVLAAPWTALTSQLPGAVACCRLDDLQLGPHGRIWERALAQIVLSRGERAVWSRLSGSSRHRSEWLLGRVAAKDAVRALLQSTSGVALCPADVEIIEEPDGKLRSTGPWSQRSPVVSLVTRDGAKVAVAGYCGTIGIALEHLASDEVGHARKHPLVAALDEPLRAEWALRLRCATQAATALGGEPAAGLVAAGLDTTTGNVLLTCGSQHHAVHTARDSDLIAALAIQ